MGEPDIHIIYLNETHCYDFKCHYVLIWTRFKFIFNKLKFVATRQFLQENYVRILTSSTKNIFFIYQTIYAMLNVILWSYGMNSI